MLALRPHRDVVDLGGREVDRQLAKQVDFGFARRHRAEFAADQDAAAAILGNAAEQRADQGRHPEERALGHLHGGG
jgi:hypothetical protein